MGMPTIADYANGRTDAKVVSLGDLDIYFSYKTPVAFRKGGRLVVSENCWSTTTGRHLNAIDGGDKKSRVSREQFELMLMNATA